MAFIFKNTNITSISRVAFQKTGVYDVYFDESHIQVISYNAISTSIRGAFYACQNLRKVSFKNAASLSIINPAAFEKCANLHDIDFTGCIALEQIASYAFACSGCESIDLTPCTSLKTIGQGVFVQSPFLKTINASGLTNLTTITDANNAEYNGLLRACPLLESIDFSGCSALTKIPNYMCESKDTKLTSVNLSGCTSLTTIGQNAFNGCVTLANANFSGCTSLTTIGQNAFQNCKVLPTITDWNNVKQTVQTFGQNSFKDCTALNMDLSHMPAVTKFDTSSFQNCTTLDTTLEECPSLVTIGQSAFNGCTSLGDIDLHGNTSLTTIGQSAFQNAKAVHVNLNNCSALTTIDQKAWYGAKTEEFYMNDCTGLTTINGDNNSGAWENAGQLRIFEAERCAALTVLGINAFKNCKNLASAKFNGCSSLNKLDDSSFYAAAQTCADGVYEFRSCGNLVLGTNTFIQAKIKLVDFRNTALRLIGASCFLNSTNKYANWGEVTTHDPTGNRHWVDFSGCDSLEYIENNAFNTTELVHLDLSGCTELHTIGSDAFSSCNAMSYCNVDNTPKITTIKSNAFKLNGSTAASIEKYAEFVTDKLKALDDSAFQGNLLIKSFDAHGSIDLEEIGCGCFHTAGNLETVDFSGCTSLTTLPGHQKNGDTGYEGAEFYKDNKLISANFTGCPINYIGRSAFFECTNANITGVDGWPLTIIGEAAFNMCQAQPTLKFTNSKLTTVNNQAFRGCNGCSEIELHFDPDVETAVYHQAFTGCGSSVGGCNIKLYCGNTMPQVTPIGADQTTGNADATWRISFGTNSGTTFHFPAAAEANAKSTAQLLEDDTKSKRNGSDASATTVDGNIAWWCCSNGGLTTTTGGSDGAQEARVNLWYTGTPTLAFDL